MHFLEAPKDVAPDGTNTAPEDVRYGFEKARDAALLLRETHEAVTGQSKAAMRDWGGDPSERPAVLGRAERSLEASHPVPRPAPPKAPSMGSSVGRPERLFDAVVTWSNVF